MIFTKTEKLFSPLEFNVQGRKGPDEYNVSINPVTPITHDEAFGYINEIKGHISKSYQMYDKEIGLIGSCENDALRDKVQSLFPSVEHCDGKLWLVANLCLNEPLSPLDMNALKEWWNDALYSGWGAGIDARAIIMEHVKLYLVPWTSSPDFFIEAQDEFAHRIGVKVLQELGIDFPFAAGEAKTPRPEPEVTDTSRRPDKGELAALKLSARFDQNLNDYTDHMMKLDKQDIIGNAKKIAAMQDAHEYLTQEHEFTADEVAFYLKFQIPLEIVTDHWPRLDDLIEPSHIMGDIYRLRDTIQQHYPLASGVSEEFAAAVAELEALDSDGKMSEQEFRDKMSALLDGCDSEAMQSLIAYAKELDQAGTISHNIFFKETYVEFYLVAQQYGSELSRRLLDVYKTFTLNPFEVRGASHYLDNGADAEKVGQLAVDGKCDRSMAEWEEFEDALDAFADGLLEIKSKLPTAKHDGGALTHTGEKPSVLAQIRGAAQTPKEPQSDKSTKNKSGPER